MQVFINNELKTLVLLMVITVDFGKKCCVDASSSNTIIIDWLIPTEEEEDVYDGIKAHVGDTVKFQWSAYSHNVFIHPSGDCSEDGAIQIARSSNNGDAIYKFLDDDIGKVSFACDVGSHCENGQFVTITVNAGGGGDTTQAPTKSPAAGGDGELTQAPTISPASPTSNPPHAMSSSASKSRHNIGLISAAVYIIALLRYVLHA
jgi:plastocyanin